MAQPSGQLALASGNSSEYFWYAQGTGIWDAKNSAMLTKTGSAGMSTDGGANVALGNGSTFYALPSTVTKADDYTLIVRAKVNPGAGTAAMVLGDPIGGLGYLWLREDNNEVKLLMGAGGADFTAGAVNTLATWAFVHSGTDVLTYKDGTLVNTSTGQTSTLTITKLLSGYSGDSFALSGEFECANVIPSALTAGEITTRTADLYAVLASGGGNAAPTFPGPNIGAQSGTVGVALTSNNVASKFSDTDALTFSAIGSWPAGVTVSSAGVISGTPTTAGTYATLKVRATDTADQTIDSDTFTFTISATADTTAPTQTGTITISNKTTTSYTATWPAGADNIAVTGYQYRINAGAWQTLGNVLTVDITGRTPGATDTFEVRAFDAAANYSTPALSIDVTLNAAAGSFTSAAMENNTGAGVLNTVTVNWTWYQGAIGASPTDMIHGTGTTNSSGVLTVTGLPTGAGFLLARTADATGVYYQAGTVS